MLKKNLDLNSIRSQIISKGYYVFRNFISPQDCIKLREVVSKKMLNCPEHNLRINSNTIQDYIHKRSHDKKFRTLRYYSFFHNDSKWTSVEKKVLNQGLEIRNKIESDWIANDNIFKNNICSLQNYNIFTKYIPSSGMLIPHRDWPKKLKYPLLQFNLILSQKDKDFSSGEFIFEDYNQNTLKIHEDLKMELGDALLFDKFLLHSVQLTEKGITDVGRWSVLIGARANKISIFNEKLIFLKENLKKMKIPFLNVNN